MSRSRRAASPAATTLAAAALAAVATLAIPRGAARAKPVAAPPPPPPSAACVLVEGDGTNAPFAAATALDKKDKEADREYAIYERGAAHGVTFYLRAGHGVARLEAWSRGKLVGATWFQTGRDPAHTDELFLDVRGSDGKLAEAQCTDAAKLHGL